MLNFEQAKQELLYEKERLEIIIKAQKELLEILKPMDGKMFNCRIAEHIENNQKFHAHIYDDKYNKDRKQLIIRYADLAEEIAAQQPKLRRHNDYWNVLFWELKATFTDDEGKRFSYQKFRAKLLEKITENRASLAAINADLATGADRLREACMVMEYYKSIVRSFSGYIRSEHRSEFDVGYIG